MLFVLMGKPRDGNSHESLARRMKWQYPEGLRNVAEYWPQGCEYHVISICEADNVAPIMATLGEWDDVFVWTVAPAVTAEEGMRLAQKDDARLGGSQGTGDVTQRAADSVAAHALLTECGPIG